MVNFLFDTTLIGFSFCTFDFVLISDGQYGQRIYVFENIYPVRAVTKISSCCVCVIISRQRIEQPGIWFYMYFPLVFHEI